MSIENHVTSFELSQKIVKLVGYDANIEFFHVENTESKNKYVLARENGITLTDINILSPAFLAQEILDELPTEIQYKEGDYFLKIEKFDGYFLPHYINTNDYGIGDLLTDRHIRDSNLAEALGNLLVWLYEKKILVKQIPSSLFSPSNCTAPCTCCGKDFQTDGKCLFCAPCAQEIISRFRTRTESHVYQECIVDARRYKL